VYPTPAKAVAAIRTNRTERAIRDFMLVFSFFSDLVSESLLTLLSTLKGEKLYPKRATSSAKFFLKAYGCSGVEFRQTNKRGGIRATLGRGRDAPAG
jgi:hypothetical protein